MSRPPLAGVTAFVALALLCMMLPAGAPASEGKPLEITRFTIEPTERTEEQLLGEEASHIFKFYEFVNVPYSAPFTQAGGRPWALTTTGEFATEEGREGVPTRDVKDIVVDLPPGLLGNPMAVPACPLSLVTKGIACPAATQVGVYRLHDLGATKEYLAQIVNVKPEAGQSAEFALENTGGEHDVPLLTAHLVRRTEQTAAGPVEKYGFDVASANIPVIALKKFELTFWGVPADPSHDAMRGMVCRKAEREPLKCEGGGEAAGAEAVPFLQMPSDCTAGPEVATMRADSWEEPGTIGEQGQYSGFIEASYALPQPTGCGVLSFKPGTGVEATSNTTLADEPIELGVNLKVPQSQEPASNATPFLRQTLITLPEGMSVSPGVVDGIRACNATGPEGINITGPESEQRGADGEWQLAPGKCPQASIVGEAEAITPFLPQPVRGHVYLARPGCGNAALGQAACTQQDVTDGNLYRLYLELGGEGALGNTGIEFKVPLETLVNPATGQITARASELLQAPYSEVRVRLNGGPRAPLDNPAACGPAVTTADFTPWSAPGQTPEGLLVAGTPDLLSASQYKVEGCASPQPFSPGFTAGTVSPQAGSFSSFTMNLSRGDREQFVKGVQVHTPPGLLAMLSSVPLCPEDQADDPAAHGECTASKIGTTRVASGAGSHPFEIEGNVYLTGPYDGAPFGLSIVTHAVAGPFNLGLVVVRARIEIDPHDSTATITTDETGPYALPQIVFGVPLRLKRVTVNIDRPGFMFNPTSCGAEHVTAVVSGSAETAASLSSPFAAAGCAGLAFKPSFQVSAGGHTSRRFGASLDVKLSYPKDAMGADANIAKVKVELPRQLPSRLETLKKACLAETFEANPAACPHESVVGIVRASTPVLPVPLSGPAYFVSHGGAEFPSLVVVLQGDGVRVDLEGETFINKRTDITSSTFKAVPDVPVNTFELYLPQGKYSALAANGNLCTVKGGLRMPTEFTAQNGAVVRQDTRIGVTGCGGAHAARRGGRASAAAGNERRHHR